MFEHIERVPGDAILGLIEAFKKDTNPQKVDLGVGVYKDAQGNTPVMRAVKEAEALLLKNETTKTYIGSHGAPAYGEVVLPMVLGEGSPVLEAGRASATQSPGGTGALRLAADFIAKQLPGKGIWVSDPTWPNHHGIFTAAGIALHKYPYVDADNRLDFDGMLAALKQIPEGDVVVLHACCHNPTGVDPTLEQWAGIVEVIKARKLVPFLDIAYQGFGDGLEEDAAVVRMFADQGLTMLISSSFSKSFSLYGERVGALTIVAGDKEEGARVLSQVKRVIRTNYSNPPTHGGTVVATVLNAPELFSLWSQELAEMRERIRLMRRQLVDKLKALGVAQDMEFVVKQRGMFSYSGLSAEQVERLRQDHAIYAVSSGRICVAALNSGNIDRVAQAIAAVMK